MVVFTPCFWHDASMSDKEPAAEGMISLDDHPPEEVGERRAEFIAGIKQALVEVERGETYTMEEMLKFVEEWEHE